MIRASSIKQLPGFGIKRIAVACGVFDGLHIGHQEIIKTLIQEAQRTDAVPVILTFNPHPRSILNPETAPKLLLSSNHKLYLLRKLQVRVTVVIPFTKSLSTLSPENFIADMLCDEKIEITSFCVGKNWKFGYKGRGDTKLLSDLGKRHGFDVIPVPELGAGDSKVSSTLLRNALKNGQLNRVKSFLGRNFSIMGTVEFGKGIATSELYYPTANIEAQNEVFPPNGIYAAKACLSPDSDSPKYYSGVLYLGQSPTFIDDPPEKPYVEINIFDFGHNIYGETVEVELIKFLRGDQKFDSVSELRDQIERDVKAAKNALLPAE